MLRFYRKKTEDLIIVIERKLKIFIFLTMKKNILYMNTGNHMNKGLEVFRMRNILVLGIEYYS